MKLHYVVGVYGYNRASLVSLDGTSKLEAERQRKWQGTSNYHVCTARIDRKPGTFQRVDNGLLLECSRTGWTEKAWIEFLDKHWV